MMYKKLTIALLLFVVFATVACKKGEDPSKRVNGVSKVSYFAKALGTGIKTVGTKANGTFAENAVVDWTFASIYVEKISFVGVSDNLIDTTISVQKNINLFSKDALTGVIQLPAGSYKNVKVKMFLRKNGYPDLAFFLKGTFTNSQGGRDSLLLASSYPFEVNLGVPDIVIDPTEAYDVTFNFDLNKGLAGISAESLQTARSYGFAKPTTYVIWKGGSQDEPFYDQVIANWQTVASATIVIK